MSAAKLVGRLVAPRAVLLQRLHHDPVQLAADQSTLSFFGSDLAVGGDGWQRVAERADPQARLGRLFFADDPPHFVEGRLSGAAPDQTASSPVSSS